MTCDSTHGHPVFDRMENDTDHNRLLSGTDPGFPVGVLLGQEDTIAMDPEKPVFESTETQISQEFLSPFAQWLLTLSPTGFSGGESRPVLHTPPALIPETAPVKVRKKKSKKKKKKKKKGDSSTPAEVQASGLITDTLAELVARQGHPERAIEMYRKLAVLHPDRAAFYEERIRELEAQ